MRTNALRLPLGLGALAASLFILFACHLSGNPETEETFSFPSLKDSVKTADTVLIVLKAPNGQVIDTLFHDKLTPVTSFADLKAEHYTGGPVLIHIEAIKDGKLIYKVERGYDPAQGGDLPKTKVVYVTPSMGIRIDRTLSVIREGETVPVPGHSVVPTSLNDPTALWTSRNPGILRVEGNTLVAVAPGQVYLVAALAVDTSKKDSIPVEVISKIAPQKPIDSLLLDRDTLFLAMGGPTGRFTLRAIPVTASTEATWSLLSGTSIQLAPDGLITPMAEGLSRVAARSKLDSTVGDTAVVQVLPKRTVDSVRFARASLDLFAGGAAENLLVQVYPLLAPQGVELTVKDTALARLTGNALQGRREGETWVVATSLEDASKKDTLHVTVFPSEKVDSVKLQEDSLVLYVRGESKSLTASIYPVSLQKRFAWRSTQSAIATVDADGFVAPVKEGKTWVTVLSRADSTRKDSAQIIVKQDTPRLHVGSDTLIARGATVVYAPEAPQEYGEIAMFKWDLNGDGTYEDSSTTLRASLSATYPEVKTYQVRFYVRDTEGNEITVIRKVTAVSGRVVQITSPKDGAYVNATPVTVTWTVDGQPLTNTQALTAGANTLVRSAKDSAGTEFSHSITVHLDQTAPNRPMVKGPTLPVNTLTPQWTWQSGGNGGSGTYRFRIGNQDLSSQPTTTDTVHTAGTNLSGGTHTLYVQERDLAGNWSESGFFPIRIDTTAPKPPTVTVAESSPTREMRPTWTWTGGLGDAHRYYRFKLDNDDFRSGSKDTVGTTFRPSENLFNGSHTLYVQERDTAGNWSFAGSAPIVIDTARPAAPVVNGPALTNNPTPTWTWTTSTPGAVTFRYKLDDPNLATGATITTLKEFTPGAPLAEGNRTLYVQESDAAGNWSNSGSRTIRLDLTKPTSPRIDSTPYSPLNSLRPRFTWRSGTGGAKVFRARIDDPNLEGQPELTDSAFVPTADLGEGRRILYVQERDSAGNWSISASTSVLLAQRQIVGNRAFSQAYSTPRSLVFNSSGVPYVLCRAPNSSSHVMSLFGNTWGMIGLASVGNLSMEYAGIVITGAGIPMLAYTESHPDTSWIKIGAGLLSFRNGSWSKEGLSLGGDVELKYITLDHSGNPVVAGRISGGDDPTNLFISMWNGNAWTTIGNMHPAPSSASPQNINLAFNSNGDAFVAFFNAANDGVSVMKCTKGATEWTFLGGENPLGLKAYRLKLILDRQENPVLALDHSQTIQLAKYSGGAWSVAPGPAKSCGGSFGFAIDRGNNPILAFSNCGTTQVNIMSNVNGNWTGMGVTGVLPPQVTDVGQFDISIAPSGIPHLVFVDNANEERATVSKVAFDP